MHLFQDRRQVHDRNRSGNGARQSIFEIRLHHGRTTVGKGRGSREWTYLVSFKSPWTGLDERCRRAVEQERGRGKRLVAIKFCEMNLICQGRGGGGGTNEERDSALYMHESIQFLTDQAHRVLSDPW